MTRGMAYAVIAVLVLLSGAPVWAQQPGPSQGGGPQPPGAAQPMDVSGAEHQGRPSHHMMQMCRQMMGHEGPMGGMMGTRPMMSSDPKQQAEMMAMRGEMMKAMGDIMMKYAERMRPPN
jgi:hypothetical protein